MKSTKIIAGLGVAAALGVAALPVASFAAGGTTTKGTVTVNASVNGHLTIKMTNSAGTESDDIANTTSWTDTVGFGSLANKEQKVIAGATKIEVDTNYPNAYTLTGAATALANSVSGGGSIALTDGYNFDTAGSAEDTYTATTSVWGIKVVKSGNDSTLTNTDGYSSSTYKSLASGTIDSIASSTENQDNTYAISYGIGISPSQASGNYSGSIVYTVTTTDPVSD